MYLMQIEPKPSLLQFPCIGNCSSDDLANWFFSICPTSKGISLMRSIAVTGLVVLDLLTLLTPILLANTTQLF